MPQLTYQKRVYQHGLCSACVKKRGGSFYSRIRRFLAQFSDHDIASIVPASYSGPRIVSDLLCVESCDRPPPPSAVAPRSCMRRIRSTDAGVDTSDSRSAICVRILVSPRLPYSCRRSVPCPHEPRNIVHASGPRSRNICMVSGLCVACVTVPLPVARWTNKKGGQPIKRNPPDI